MTLEQLRDKRHAKAREARAILNAAEADKRDLNDDERQNFDRLDAEITDLDGDIKRAERAQSFGDEAEHVAQTDDERAAEAQADKDRLAAFRAREGRDPTADELSVLANTDERAVADTLNEYRKLTYGGVPQNKDEFRQAFYRYMSATFAEAKTLGDEYRVLSGATNPGGGYLVPTTFERTLLERAREFGVMRDLATVITTTTGEPIVQPAEDTHGTASWIAANAAYPESDEAFAQFTLNAYKAGTLMRVAEELLQDAAFDLEGYIARQYAARIGILENTAYVSGDGVGKPTGIVTSAAVGETLPAGNTVGFTTEGSGDYIVRLTHSVIRAYRNRGAFLMRDATLLGVRLLKDNDGQYLWRPGLESDAPDTLLGYPVHTDPDMPAQAASAKSVLFGDFSAYVIRDVQGVGMQRLVELYAGNGQIGFRGYHRTDGKLSNTDAVKALAQSAA